MVRIVNADRLVGRGLTTGNRCEHHQYERRPGGRDGNAGRLRALWAVEPVRAAMRDDRCMKGTPLVGGRATAALHEKRPSSHEAARPFRFRPCESGQSSNNAAGAASHFAASTLAPEAFQPTIPLA